MAFQFIRKHSFKCNGGSAPDSCHVKCHGGDTNTRTIVASEIARQSEFSELRVTMDCKLLAASLH